MYSTGLNFASLASGSQVSLSILARTSSSVFWSALLPGFAHFPVILLDVQLSI
jgi:hypothetical protein